MHINFKLEVDKTDSLNYPDFEPEEIDKWLNIAQERYVKQRYSGMNMHRASFEQTQKRMDDLRILLTNAEITTFTSTTANKPNGKFAILPTGVLPDPNPLYWLAVNEETEIVYMDCDSTEIKNGGIKSGTYYMITSGSITYDSVAYNEGDYFVGASLSVFTGTGTIKTAKAKRIRVKPKRHDEYNEFIRDPFNKPFENEVVRLSFQDSVELITDGTFVVSKYFLRYIRKPLEILLDLLVPANSVNCELADITHQEIVEQAAQLALESIESPRYQTITMETSKQE